MPGRPERLNLYSTFHGPDCQAQKKCLLAGDWGVREAANASEPWPRHMSTEEGALR